MENTSVEHKLIQDKEFDALKVEITNKPYEKILKGKYPAKEHARKVAEQLAFLDLASGGGNTKNGIIYLPGEPTRYFENSDQSPAFRQRRYFYYITGVDFPDCSVTYEIAKDRLILWIPFVEPRQVLWYGSHPDIEEAKRLYDVDDVHYTRHLPNFFDDHVKPETTVYILGHDQMVFQYRNKPIPCQYVGRTCKLDTRHLQPAMDRARVIKDEYEIALIRKANDISSAAHREVAESLLRLKNEREIEAIIQASCISHEGRFQAYSIIAGAGTNASTLHYEDNNQPLEGKQLVVVDAGCEYRCYASDITRTLPISGSFTREAKAVHEIVQRMQDECIQAVKPGREFVDLHLHAAKVAVEGLLELGILRGELEEVEKSGVVSAFFPHGLGHYVGLDVHDVSGCERLLQLDSESASQFRPGKREMVEVPDLQNLRTMQVHRRQNDPFGWFQLRPSLKVGMVVTIEPGIYFCRQFLEGYYLCNEKLSQFIDADVLERYYPVGGVRIEDDVLVTETGFENLTNAPKGEELLQVINGDFEMVG